MKTISDERKEFLENLSLKANIAGDDYYFEMDEENFEKALGRYKDEDFYEEYRKQREIGFEQYQEEVKAEFSKITSSEELHFMVKNRNYDDGQFLLEQVAFHPLCDIETAKMIYWFSEAIYYYDEYGGVENCPESDVNIDTAMLIVKMEQKAKNGGYKTGLVAKKNEDVEEMINEIDFSTLPFSKIPECFRS